VTKREPPPRGATVARVRELLERSRHLRRERVASPGLSDARRLLAEWQSRRLADTYADFAAQPRYRPAVRFFLEDLYGPVDFAQRDADIERVYPVMTRVLSAHALASVTQALELHALSEELDARMARVLTAELGMTDRLDDATYAEAFRRCDDRAARLRQIELVEQIGRTLDDVVNNPVIYATVVAARLPAKLAGFGELQDFIERGLHAFRHMRGAREFIAAVGERERGMLDLMRAGAAPAAHGRAFSRGDAPPRE
jgi:hypothetical protein